MKAKARYKVDLPKHLAECEVNYQRLGKLMPNLPERDTWLLALRLGEDNRQIHIRVLERARYTTTILISQQATNGSRWHHLPQLTVRLYHDAKMAEVLAWEHHRGLLPRYHYPNVAMYQHDEKAQINGFLGEWLSHCLREGRSTEEIITLKYTR